MAITISVSSMVSGSCKTTIAYLFAYMLSTSYKVLASDLCGQCHMTEVFLGDQTEAETICDAFDKGDIVSTIRPITNKLHIVPGDMWNSHMHIKLYQQGYSTTEVIRFLSDMVNKAKANYDFVVIDTPSTSADELFNLSLSTSDFAVMTYSPNKINLIEKWLDKTRQVQDLFNPQLKVGGILRTRFNDIENLHKYQSQEVVRHYPEYCWNSIFPSSPLFANIDFYDIQKTGRVNAIKPIYDEMILRLLKTRTGV